MSIKLVGICAAVTSSTRVSNHTNKEFCNIESSSGKTVIQINIEDFDKVKNSKLNFLRGYLILLFFLFAPANTRHDLKYFVSILTFCLSRINKHYLLCFVDILSFCVMNFV